MTDDVVVIPCEYCGRLSEYSGAEARGIFRAFCRDWDCEDLSVWEQDIKQLRADAKEQGLDADAIAKVAAGKVKDKLRAKAKAYRRMRDAAREGQCGEHDGDARMTLEPQRQFGVPSYIPSRESTIDQHRVEWAARYLRRRRTQELMSRLAGWLRRHIG